VCVHSIYCTYVHFLILHLHGTWTIHVEYKCVSTVPTIHTYPDLSFSLAVNNTYTVQVCVHSTFCTNISWSFILIGTVLVFVPCIYYTFISWSRILIGREQSMYSQSVCTQYLLYICTFLDHSFSLAVNYTCRVQVCVHRTYCTYISWSFVLIGREQYIYTTSVCTQCLLYCTYISWSFVLVGREQYMYSKIVHTQYLRSIHILILHSLWPWAIQYKSTYKVLTVHIHTSWSIILPGFGIILNF
jgi:hypothetical protein